MIAQGWAESSWEITNYGRFINQFPPNIIRSIRQFESDKKKYVDKKCLLCLIKYIYIYIYIYQLAMKLQYYHRYGVNAVLCPQDHGTFIYIFNKVKFSFCVFCFQELKPTF